MFDKTGTLTKGFPELSLEGAWTKDDLATAAALAGHSTHPLSKALARAASSLAASEVEEAAGQGVRGKIQGHSVHLGQREWCGVDAPGSGGMELWLAGEGRSPVRFTFSDQLRVDAKDTIDALQSRGLDVRTLSGDRRSVVEPLADHLGIKEWQAECLPAYKVAALEVLKGQGRRVVMVGDGLDDAPAFAAGFVSISPASAADVSQTAADLFSKATVLGLS